MGRIVRIKNISGETQDIRKFWNVGEEFTVPDSDIERDEWAKDSRVLSAVSVGVLQVGNGSEYFQDVAAQIQWLQGSEIYIGSIPSEPDNVHTMQGFATEHEFTPQADGENGFLPNVKDVVVEHATHSIVRLWGVKFRVDVFEKGDQAAIQIGSGTGENFQLMLQYARWNVWAEDGTIMCPKSPDGSSGRIPVGATLRLVYYPKSAAARFWAINWIASVRDGEEVQS